MAVVDQLWQHAQIVLVGQLLIVDLNETNVQLIRLVVNIFQLLQSLLALFALGFVYSEGVNQGERLEWMDMATNDKSVEEVVVSTKRAGY